MVLESTVSSSTKNLSNQGSLKNHFLKEFFKQKNGSSAGDGSS